MNGKKLLARYAACWHHEWFTILCGVFFLQCVSCVVLAEELQYKLSFTANNDVEIQVAFTGHQSGESTILLPDNYAGNNNLYQQITIRGVQGGSLHETEQASRKIIKHQPNAQVVLDYIFHTQVKQQPNNLFEARAPTVTKEFFHFIGAAMFIVPKFLMQQDIKISLLWQVADSWQLANSFGKNQRKQQATTTVVELLNSLFIGGDFRLIEHVVHNQSVLVALRGKLNFSDDALCDKLLKIIAAERTFWNDHSQKFFLVSVSPIQQDSKVISGMGLNNAFAIFVTAKQPLDVKLIKLFAHEYFHVWNNPRLFAKSGKGQEEFFWFTEGLTAYYTDLLTLRANLMNLRDYIEAFNKFLFEYYTSNAKKIANEKIQHNFWNDYDVSKIAYQRGYLLAHNWNAEIILTNKKLASKSNKSRKSLDDLMLAWIAKYQQLQINNETLDLNILDNIAKKYLPHGILEDINKYVIAGNVLHPHPASLGPCVAIKLEKKSVIDYGFDLDSSITSGVIQKVVQDGVAYNAGLRNNQKLISIDIQQHAAVSSVSMSVTDEANSKEIIFDSVVQATKIVPQFKLNSKKAYYAPHDCLHWFGTIDYSR